MATGDMIVADIEGIVVIPKSERERVFQLASEKTCAEASLTLSEWETRHREKISKAISSAKTLAQRRE